MTTGRENGSSQDGLELREWRPARAVDDAPRCEALRSKNGPGRCPQQNARVRRRPNGRFVCDQHWMSGYVPHDFASERDLAQEERMRRVCGEDPR